MDLILKEIRSRGSSWNSRFIPDYSYLEEIREELKRRRKKVVLTQGVYDLIHIGHATYLEKARTFGDFLIVAVDSDELARKRKGPDRPIVPQEERLRMLSHLRCVDILTLKTVDEDEGEVIHRIKPDVLVVSESTVKIEGGKSFPEQMKEDYKDFCGEIVSMKPQGTTSTTARVRNLTIEGASKLSVEINRLTKKFIDDLKS